MPRWFNTAGPCNPADHYMLPAEERLPAVRDLVDRKACFSLRAPRQVGKTTSLRTLAQDLTAEGRCVAVLVSAEVGPDVANPICREIIVRELAFPIRAPLPQIKATWLTQDGRLDADRLLDAFLSFWRRHGEPLLRAAPYHEIAPHLVVMARSS
ncbi:hypothetical protein ACSRUE_22695 [Sorangium sp. KYC3313]|uniref:hypothetical protein n=1 Tax=Sorangium sp. KYC3313 TaxID=3449740 RepID=UPI003F88E20D